MAGYRVEIKQFTPNVQGETETTMNILHLPTNASMHYFVQRDKIIDGEDYTIVESKAAVKMLRIAANALLLKRVYPDLNNEEIAQLAIAKTENEKC